MYSNWFIFFVYYVDWQLVGLQWNKCSTAVHTVPPDDEQKSAQNMYRLLIEINEK
jgi:hypothetical protein